MISGYNTGITIKGNSWNNNQVVGTPVYTTPNTGTPLHNVAQQHDGRIATLEYEVSNLRSELYAEKVVRQQLEDRLERLMLAVFPNQA